MHTTFKLLVCAACFIAIATGGIVAQTLQSGPQLLCFLSDIDDTEQPYTIYIPPEFDESKAYPLVVMLHGAGSNHRLALRRVFGKSNLPGENDVEASAYFPEWQDVDMIVAAPFARGTMGYQGFAEKDVMDMIADIKRRFRIDENRTYLTGLSMGGGGTLWLGLSYPDMWAAIAPVCPAPPAKAIQLAPNALHMAVRFVHGTNDGAVPVEVSREWVGKLKLLGTKHVEYEELPGVDHWSWVQAYEDGRVFDWLAGYERDPYPSRVRLSAIDLAHAESYWVRIDQKHVETTAFIEAEFNVQNNIHVYTSGVIGFTLDLEKHPMITSDNYLKVRVDGKMFDLDPSRGEYGFSRKNDNGEWQPEPYRATDFYKTARLEGPIDKAFGDRHVYVYGTADNPTDKVLQERIDQALTAANWSRYRSEFLGRIRFYPRVVADKHVRESDFAESNLILFGTAETNSVIGAYQELFPLALKENKARKFGLVYVFPNIHDQYVVVNSGLPWWLMEKDVRWRFLPPAQSVLGDLKDYVLFSKNLRTKIEGHFDQNWELSSQQLDILQNTGALREKR